MFLSVKINYLILMSMENCECVFETLLKARYMILYRNVPKLKSHISRYLFFTFSMCDEFLAKCWKTNTATIFSRKQMQTVLNILIKKLFYR